MMREREYGIDLMKIVAMIFIVADHILLWGGWGLCSEHGGVKGNVLAWLDAVTLCHVNCFVLASGWIMSRKRIASHVMENRKDSINVRA